MADNTTALTTIRGGINRQRTKGGAPQDALYDLLNGYVSKSKTIVPRPGTVRTYDLSVTDAVTRVMTAGEGTDGVFTLLGYVSDTAGDILGIGAVGSLDATGDTYQGFPILAIYWVSDFTDFIYLWLGKNAANELPDPGVNFDATATFTISGVPGASFDSVGPPIPISADAVIFEFNYTTNPASPFVNGQAYPFSFDPEDDPPSSSATNPTRGLVSFDGGLHVFCHEEVVVPTGITLHVITHPDQTPDNPIPIDEIDFAAPFMGYIYVAATFTNGDCVHFWLQEGPQWQADTAYKLGDIVIPTATEFAGLAFQAQRLGEPNPAWQPNVSRSLGDVVEPTVYNDFQYTVVDTQGDNPRSGTTEPTWPTEDGAQVIEDADGTDPNPPSITEMPDTSALPAPAISDRYSNRIP